MVEKTAQCSNGTKPLAGITSKRSKQSCPGVINTHAMIRPYVVNGYLSPYPTVGIVTNAHHKASPVSLMFASGKSSRLRIAIALNTTTQSELAATAANDVNFLCARKKVRRFFIDRNAQIKFVPDCQVGLNLRAHARVRARGCNTQSGCRFMP
jgi:hypothetical protein